MIGRPQRVLKTFDATAMVTGNMIGSGIFLLAGYAAEPVSGGWALMLAWIMGGLMALWGSLGIAELATRYPRTGGDFLYLHQVYGAYPAFLYGWMSLIITETGSIAILAIFSAKYVIRIFPSLASSTSSEQLIGSGIILFYTVLHSFRVIIGARFQSVLTVMKIGGILLLAFLLFGRESPSAANVPSVEIEHPIRGFSRALIPIFFAYSGWNVAGYVAGEVAEPRRTLPIALVGGTIITILLYLLVNGAFLNALGLDSMRGDPMVPMTALGAVAAGGWTSFLQILIFTSVVSSLSIAVQAGARVIQSMGENRLFFRITARRHRRFNTPLVALAVQGIWAIGLIHFLNIESLVDSTTVVMVLFSALTISTIIKSRVMAPSQKGSADDGFYRTPFFPLVPVLYVGSAVFIAWGVVRFYLETNAILPLWGFVFVVAGTFLYWLWRKLA